MLPNNVKFREYPNSKFDEFCDVIAALNDKAKQLSLIPSELHYIETCASERKRMLSPR